MPHRTCNHIHFAPKLHLVASERRASHMHSRAFPSASFVCSCLCSRFPSFTFKYLLRAREYIPHFCVRWRIKMVYVFQEQTCSSNVIGACTAITLAISCVSYVAPTISAVSECIAACSYPSRSPCCIISTARVLSGTGFLEMLRPNPSYANQEGSQSSEVKATPPSRWSNFEAIKHSITAHVMLERYPSLLSPKPLF